MDYVQRKITFRLYPNATQAAELVVWLALHCRVYNTLLEEHRRRYEAGEPGFNFTAMCRALTEWRGYVAALAGLNAQSMQVTAKRVALAFDAFFRRLKAGDTPGYPRFKSVARFAGWGYKTYGDGWKLRRQLTANGLHYERLELTGIGALRLRGQGRFTGSPKTLEILHRGGKWYASVTFDVAPHQVMRAPGTEAGAFDWGISTLLTIAKADDTLEEVDNPRWLKRRLGALRALQRVVSAEEARAKAKLGLAPDAPLAKGQRLPLTARLKRLYAQVRALYGKIARQRQDFYHKLTALLVSRFAFLASEELAVAAMTRTPKPKPDPENPGKYLPNGAAAKAGLNRGILDAAPSMLLGMLRTKAAEAGSEFALANTRKVKPTQRCHRCGALVPKELAEREHHCACGCHCGRDENAARTLLRWMLEGDFWSGTDRAGLAACQKLQPIAA